MKVLFATDGSPSSLGAMKAGIRLLPLKTAQIHIVAVANPLGVLPAYEAAAAGALLIADKLVQAAAADLRQAEQVFQEAGLAATTEEVEGDPASAILEAAHHFGADLVVLGSHGKGALERFFVGSVSDRVNHHWPGAVLIVHPTPQEES